MAHFTIQRLHSARKYSKFYRIDTDKILMADDVSPLHAAAWALILEDMLGNDFSKAAYEGINILRSPYVAYQQPLFEDIAPCTPDMVLRIDSKNITDARLDIFIEYNGVSTLINDLYAKTPGEITVEHKRPSLKGCIEMIESCIFNYLPSKEATASIHRDGMMSSIAAGIVANRAEKSASFEVPSYDLMQVCGLVMARALDKQKRLHSGGDFKLYGKHTAPFSPVHFGFIEAGFLRCVSPFTPKLYKLMPNMARVNQKCPDFLMDYGRLVDGMSFLSDADALKISHTILMEKDQPNLSSHAMMSAHRLLASLQDAASLCLSKDR